MIANPSAPAFLNWLYAAPLRRYFALLPGLGFNLLLFSAAVFLMPKNDFGRTFYSARQWLANEPMYAVNDAIVWESEKTIIHLYNLNPPHFHLVLLPFAYLSDDVAMGLWMLLNGICLFASLALIRRELNLQLSAPIRYGLLILGLAFVGTNTAIYTAHMGFILTLLATLAWRAARRTAWGEAGAWLGLAISVKPFLGLFILYFLVRRHWRAVIGCGLSGLAFTAAGALLFGVSTYQEWLGMLRSAPSWAWLPMNASLLGSLTRIFLNTEGEYQPLLILPASVVTWTHRVFSFALLTWMFWKLHRRKEENVDQAFAAVVIASLLVSPLGWTYYLWIAAAPLMARIGPWWNWSAPNRSWPLGRKLFVLGSIGMLFPCNLLHAGSFTVSGTVAAGIIYFASLLSWFLSVMMEWNANEDSTPQFITHNATVTNSTVPAGV